MAWKKAIEVKVLVNGTAAQEYNDDEEEESSGPPIVKKYIEAISGAEFALQLELKPSCHFRCELMMFQILIDGKNLESSLVTKAKFEEQPRGSEDHPQNTDSDLKDRVVQLGTIRVEVHRVHGGVYREPGTSGSGWQWDELTELGTLPEKALKGHALSHNASLGLPQFTPPRGVWLGIEYLDGKYRPFAVFNFKYRSQKSLHDLRIIPRTPTPVPLEDRPIEELTIEEARELLKRQRERQGSTVSEGKVEIKAERGIKREYEDDEEYNALLSSARPNKLARKWKEGEIIDLLED
ncbi:MAG: hypothetical protein M1830_010057 [Pleopsidium flavum]|nr:MAG: hypothetical protein M1830_010057 [Pleopsidium flavum]